MGFTVLLDISKLPSVRTVLFERARCSVLSFASSTQRKFAHSSSRRGLPVELESVISQVCSPSRASMAELKKKYGDTVFDNVTVRAALGGMRDTKILLCETSQVDPKNGLSYRGIPLHQLSETLPKAKCGSQPPMEALFWLLLTGKIPTAGQIEILREELICRMQVPNHVVSAINALPVTSHPMTQFVVGIAACQSESFFSTDYKSGSLRKEDYWKPILEDGLTLVAKLPQIASQIYRRTFRQQDKQELPPADPSLDWAANVAHLMGFENTIMRDVFRLYILLHADHEGGNVSAHAAHLVGSALTDPFLSFASAMCGLAGPLHGLANQECLRFLRQMRSYLLEKGKVANEANVKDYVETEILGKGKVVPGFGHAVLRVVDPRYTLQEEFAATHIKGDELTDLLHVCAKVVPEILKATGKVGNPFPNVDAHSGVVLSHFGITEEDFYTVLFGLSRATGIVAQQVWDRIYNLPIERPKSVNLKTLTNLAAEKFNNNHNNHNHHC